MMSEEEKARACRKGGLSAAEQLKHDGKGIYALTDIERREIGRRVYQEGKGLASLTEEEKARAGRKGGNKIKELGVGICGMSHEEKVRAARLSVQSRGQVPYTDDEEDLIFRLSNEQEFIYDSRNHAGYVNCTLLADRINKEFHNGEKVRSRIAINRKLKRLRKGKP